MSTVEPENGGSVHLSRTELIALVGVLQSARGATEADDTVILRLIDRAVPHPNVSDLIFYSNPSLSAAEVVDRALSYRAIAL